MNPIGSTSQSKNLSIPSAIPNGKQPVDPNRPPIQSAHPAQEGRTHHIGPKPSIERETLSLAQKATKSDSVEISNPARIQAADTAEKLVATTLIKPILAQARAARNAPAPWGQTQAEKQFGALLDNRIADDIARASNFPITQRIAEQILKNTPITDLPSTYTPVDIFG